MRRSSVRQERCAHTTKNRMEVLCPRATQAAMIAAASFGLRRSGTFALATSGAAYWAVSVTHGPPWPLPVNAPKSIFQNSILYRAANSVGSCACRKSKPAILMMQSAQDRQTEDATNGLDSARYRRIFVQ